MIKNIATAFVIAAALNGCAGVEQKRNTENEARIAAYISKIGSAAPFNSAELCVNSTQLGAWAKYQINESTPVVATPSGARGAALCVKIPEDAKELRLDSDPTGGMSYFGMTIAHPSAQFLDGQYALVKDYPVPKMHVGQGLLNDFGLTGDFDLTKILSTSRYIVVYVHPGSLESGIDVNSGMMSMYVPYSPYGAVRLKFK
jgi:hypothetical protein